MNDRDGPDVAQARRAADLAGVLLDVHHACGAALWCYHGDRLLLTWLPQRRLAQRPHDARPVPCATPAQALDLALAASAG